MKPKSRPSSSVDAAINDLVCPICESKAVDTFQHSDSFEYGTGDAAVTLRVVIPVRHCNSCEFEFVDHEGEQLQHEAVCRHLKVLTPAEVLGIRVRYGMTRAAFAKATGLGEATLGRWETGALIQNRANDLYLRLIRWPFAMKILQRLSARTARPARELGGSDRSFLRLVVNESVLQAQKNFRLHSEGF